MDEHTATAALRAITPRLMGAPIETIAAAATTAWNAHSDRTAMQATAVRAVVDAAWGPGHHAGVRRGQHVTGAFLASAILRRAEPAQPGMTGFHTLVANWLHAARVEPQRLHGYLSNAGWRPTARQETAEIFVRDARRGAADQPAVAAPTIRREDHELMVVNAATVLAALEQRDVANVLEDLAPTTPDRAPMSQQALDLLRVAYQAAKDASSTGLNLTSPGPHDNDYRLALGDWTDDTDAGRLATAVRVGYVHGFRAGHNDASWSVSGRVLAMLDSMVPERTQRAVLIDGRSGYDWLRAVEVDTRWAAEADFQHRVSHPGFVTPPESAPTVWFGPVTSPDALPRPVPSRNPTTARTRSAAVSGRLAFAPLLVDTTGPHTSIASAQRHDSPQRTPPTSGRSR